MTVREREKRARMCVYICTHRHAEIYSSMKMKGILSFFFFLLYSLEKGKTKIQAAVVVVVVALIAYV